MVPGESCNLLLVSIQSVRIVCPDTDPLPPHLQPRLCGLGHVVTHRVCGLSPRRLRVTECHMQLHLEAAVPARAIMLHLQARLLSPTSGQSLGAAGTAAPRKEHRTFSCLRLLCLLGGFIVMAFGLVSLGSHCCLRLSPAGLFVAMVPECCWDSSAFAV